MDDNGGSGRPAAGPDGGPGDSTYDTYGTYDTSGTSSSGGGDGEWAVPGYAHERELGAGASGRVVLARHEPTGTAVAIKYLTGHVGRDHRFREAFRDEARLLGDLDSPYIARFYEYVEDGRHAAIVMELVDGIALRTLLRQEGATDPEPALTVLKGSLLGLAAAHAAGVVHRDYKPANVLVGTDGLSKLVDFGVAVRSGETGAVAGTPSYMAPEQWAGKPATPATDVYAATVTFYECLTGTKPYTGSTMFELAVQHAEAPIPNDQVPEPVRPLIRRGLAKTPPERPQSAADFVAELQAVATAAYGEDWEERGQRKLAALVALLPLLLPSAAGGGASGSTALAHTQLGEGAGALAAGGAVAAAARSHVPPLRRRLRRRGKLLVGAVVAVLISAGLAVTAVATSGDGPAPEGAASTPSALTSLTSGPPVAPASGPSTSGSPSASASPSASTSATPTDTPTTTAGSTATGTPTDTGTPTHTTDATTAPPTTSAPKTLHVTSVSIQSLTCSAAAAYTAEGTVTVQSNGAADGTLTLSWFHSLSKGTRGAVTVATVTVPLSKGQTTYTGSFSRDFGSDDTYPYWGLEVATTPAADTGNGSLQAIPACRPVIT